jgi:SAM-dependent methyltransferase
VLTLTPARRRGVEFLDSADLPAEIRVRSHRDIALANSLFGGTRALVTELRDVASTLPREVTVVDVGAGSGGMLRLADAVLRDTGRSTTSVALDIQPVVLAPSARDGMFAICGCATSLPLATDSVDVAMCSLLLHHFERPAIDRVLRELHRVARHRVIVCDLRRSWVAFGGLWAASYPLGFHRVSRHDGLTSILRGFTASELRTMVAEATGVTPAVRRHLGFRLTASWPAEI